jgi:hypothetical protein
LRPKSACISRLARFWSAGRWTVRRAECRK